jgi:hypothetical protein
VCLILGDRRWRAERGVGGTSTADVDGARLRRAVGSNRLSNAATACPGDRISDCLLDTVLQKIARTYRVLPSEPAGVLGGLD